ncbi:MAG: NAD-dependent malic enzyme [Firmicutes bacterium]|nr:NAD-dependent malic enzyme [Bacillota bacterium]
MDLKSEALALHRRHQGKFATISKVRVADTRDLSLAYSPGVAEPCLAIARSPATVYDYTAKGNLVAVISDGTAVLGLGEIGPLAALPVMEGKAILFKNFANVDAVPLVLATKEVEAVVETVVRIAPTFGGINLEDIAGPRCFAIEEALKERLDIPVFHDDQHGTAVVCFAGLLNALKFVGKDLAAVRVVINGAGAAGIAMARLLLAAGCREIVLCDRKGIVFPGREDVNPYKEEIARRINPGAKRGSLAEALRGADVFIGLSVAGVVAPEMIASMAINPIVFALANPVPEIFPEEARAAGAVVVATGRSDYPNQINNVLGFPGIFRGALDVRAREINEEMKLAAATAIAGLLRPEELRADYIIPNPFDRRVVEAVAIAVARAAVATGVAGLPLEDEEIVRTIRERLAPLAG